MTLPIVEIGSSDFLASAGQTDGLFVEPVPLYFNRLPECRKLNAAVSDHDGEVEVFYLSPEDIERYALPDWIRGCNTIGGPHPTAHTLLADRGVGEAAFSRAKVECISVPTLLARYGITHIGHLKVGTEGHDAVILHSLLSTNVRPGVITFEANSLAPDAEIALITERLMQVGYSRPERIGDDLRVEWVGTPFTVSEFIPVMCPGPTSPTCEVLSIKESYGVVDAPHHVAAYSLFAVGGCDLPHFKADSIDRYWHPLLAQLDALRDLPNTRAWVYLAPNLRARCLDGLLAHGATVHVMEHDSLAAQPGMLWRYLAWEDHQLSVTALDADEELPHMLRQLSYTRSLADGETWRRPTGCTDQVSFTYKPIHGGTFGSRITLPIRELLSGAIRACKWSTHATWQGRDWPYFGQVYPNYGWDEFFLASTVYWELRKRGGVKTYIGAGVNPLIAIDAAATGSTALEP